LKRLEIFLIFKLGTENLNITHHLSIILQVYFILCTHWLYDENIYQYKDFLNLKYYKILVENYINHYNILRLIIKETFMFGDQNYVIVSI